MVASTSVLQLTGTSAQFSLGKSFPGFGPTGPVAVTPDELPDRDDIGFASWLDGQPLQQGRTSEMIFPVDDLVARLSAVCPLLPGDLIFTGHLPAWLAPAGLRGGDHHLNAATSALSGVGTGTKFLSGQDLASGQVTRADITLVPAKAPDTLAATT